VTDEAVYAIRRQYVDTPAGQLHVRTLEARDRSAPPLLCLHPAPYSGLYFTTTMPHLNARRDVLAPDYPGYGGSTALDAAPAIADFAAAMLACIDAMEVNEPIDVLGFHTGCLVAVEMALTASGRCGRLVLCDVPYFDEARQATLRERVGQPLALSDEFGSLEPAWQADVLSRVELAGLERSVELFAERLRALPRDHEAFLAAFSYPCAERFAALDASIAGRLTIIATKSGLADATREAAAAVPGAVFVDAGDIEGAVFEAGAARIAQHVLAALD